MIKWGYEKHKYYKPRSKFFIVQIIPYFQFQKRWYRRKGELRDIILQYYITLRFVLQSKPLLRDYLTRCKYCRIFFLTCPQNAGRDDLHCPFGCREANRKKSAEERCKKYYQTDRGKKNKRVLNSNRYRHNMEAKHDLMKMGIGSNFLEEQIYYKVGEMSIGEGSVHYLMMVSGLIEGRKVKSDEIIFFLKKKERQRRMLKRKKMVYDISGLKKNSS